MLETIKKFLYLFIATKNNIVNISFVFQPKDESFVYTVKHIKNKKIFYLDFFYGKLIYNEYNE